MVTTNNISSNTVPIGSPGTEGREPDPFKAHRRSRPLFDPPIVKRAIRDAFVKLDPRTEAKNPVMFVVWVGSVITTLIFIQDLFSAHVGKWDLAFVGQITLWLWFTVLFANFAEAIAEGRGKAQADELRKTRSTTMAKRLDKNGKVEQVAGPE